MIFIKYVFFSTRNKKVNIIDIIYFKLIGILAKF